MIKLKKYLGPKFNNNKIYSSNIDFESNHFLILIFIKIFKLL